jgi:hypothetical protein
MMLIGDRFEPIGRTRAGDMKARDRDTAQTVVLKECGGLDHQLVGIFHPALLTIFAIVKHNGRYLAATELTEAKSLSELFADVPCHPRRAAEIASELADGVAELHSHHICHGAIGLTSALLTAKGKAKLSLTTAIGGTEHADLKSLKLLFCTIGGQLTPDAAGAQTAPALTALLRTFA